MALSLAELVIMLAIVLWLYHASDLSTWLSLICTVLKFCIGNDLNILWHVFGDSGLAVIAIRMCRATEVGAFLD